MSFGHHHTPSPSSGSPPTCISSSTSSFWQSMLFGKWFHNWQMPALTVPLVLEARKSSLVSSLPVGVHSHPTSLNDYAMTTSSRPASPNHLYSGQHYQPTIFGDVSVVRNLVLIGMDASKDPSETCLLWALQNLIRPGDSVTVLGIIHRINTPMGYTSQVDASDFVGTNKAALEAEMSQKLVFFEKKLRVLADLCDNRGVHLDITIVAGTPLKTVLVKEATKMKATHVILDRHLRRERKYYKDHLQCCVVAILEKNQPDYIRESSMSHTIDNPGLPFARLNSATSTDPSSRSSTATSILFDGISIPNSDLSFYEGYRAPPLSATEQRDFTTSDCHSYSVSNHDRSLDSGDLLALSDVQSVASSVAPHSGESSYIDLFIMNSVDGVMPIWSTANEHVPSLSRREVSADQAGTNDKENSPPVSLLPSSNTIATTDAAITDDSAPSTSYSSEYSEIEIVSLHPSRHFPQLNELMRAHDYQYSGKKMIESRFSQLDEEVHQIETFASVVDDTEKKQESATPMEFADDILVKHHSQVPPLCSVCKLRPMELGRTPRVYDWLELKAATNSFASENLIAEGGFSFVYRGTLPDGQIVAIKKLKTTTLQNDGQFATEVEALSSAQHRNLVRLLGYCVGGDKHRFLVYEYVCNGSLHYHLSGQNGVVLQWSARYKIAIGAARGLRYLHEECRIGCIVHRDMRPSNILVTHDFVPMVGDFGLAMMNTSVEAAIETQVVGAFGYLAPEYVECGQVTSKTDVYSFGIVLLELISGCKAFDLQRPKGEISLVDWARKKLYHHRIHELVDPTISESLDMLELDMMVKAASLCIKKDPEARPGMSQVLRILEGELYEFSDDVAMAENAIVDSAPKAPDLHQSVSRSQMLQSSSRRVAIASRNWRSWVRPA